MDKPITDFTADELMRMATRVPSLEIDSEILGRLRAYDAVMKWIKMECGNKTDCDLCLADPAICTLAQLRARMSAAKEA
jgi:hypothetical protein